MLSKTYYYLVKVQYLGYRFHGWQKQPNLKTVQFMIDRTLNYILEDQQFKTLGAGRTDAMVSANEAAFELFLKGKPIEDPNAFIVLFNENLPQDIRAMSVVEVDKDFNVIKQAGQKEYLYLFAYGDKFHPFCAPIMTTILDDLDFKLMRKGAALFEGLHNFKSYCYKASDNGLYRREILKCELTENDRFTANFFPEKTYLLRVVGKGFGRNQIRLMMGALIDLGKHTFGLDYIEASLQADNDIVMEYIAPASGLILNRIEFE